ncbi:MAG: hypothetical protein GVY07_09590 [Bacteroidetes bacterium]|jgi:hypothetical protein|nr:hypothetical protein [Bacteroidota bacterium]
MIRGERLEDLAWDFIAELFEKDENGRLVKLQEYFDYMSLDELNHSDLTIELRKLVFTKVEDNIFRAVGEKDPSLRKIIRNLKLAIRDCDCNHRVCYEQGFIIIDKNDRDNLPVMPSDFMQIRLSSRLEEKMQIPDILAEAIDVLLKQDRYQKKISLVSLASVIRLTFVHFHETTAEEKQLNADESIITTEFQEFLEESVEDVRISTGYSYVRKGKISHDELDKYIFAAKDIVHDYFNNGKTEPSQFEYLKNYMPDLEYDHFRRNNRQILEYLVKLIRKDLIETFKENWS